MTRLNLATREAAANAAPQTAVAKADAAIQAITHARRPERILKSDWDQQSSAEQLRSATSGGPIQLARAEVRDRQIFIRPERSDFPQFTLPNTVNAAGFSPGLFTHDYLVAVRAPTTLTGPAGLAAIGAALLVNPTPGDDRPSTPDGTQNNVGHLVPRDDDTNLVRSFSRPSSNPRRSVAVINYTIKGHHAMDEGFVMRFAELSPTGAIVLITYGEGNALKQSFVTRFYWEGEVQRVWRANAMEIFALAAGGGR